MGPLGQAIENALGLACGCIQRPDRRLQAFSSGMGTWTASKTSFQRD